MLHKLGTEVLPFCQAKFASVAWRESGRKVAKEPPTVREEVYYILNSEAATVHEKQGKSHEALSDRRLELSHTARRICWRPIMLGNIPENCTLCCHDSSTTVPQERWYNFDSWSDGEGLHKVVSY